MKNHSYINMIRELPRLFALLLALVATPAWAQQVQPISLQQAVEMATTQSWQVRQQQQETQMALQDVRQTRQLFLPKVTLSETFVYTNNPLNSFGIKLQQQNVGMRDFDPNLLNNPDGIRNFNTQLLVQQPLLNLDGLQGRKAAQAKLQATELGEQRLKQHMAFEVKRAYYGLQVARQQMGVLLKAQAALAQALQLTEKNLQAGYAKQADLMEVRLRMLEIEEQMAQASNQAKSANEGLAFLLGMEQGSELMPTDTLSAEVPAEALALLQQGKVEERADLQALQLAAQAYAHKADMEKAGFLPRLNAFGQYDFNDQNPFGGSGSAYLVGVSLQWSVFDGGARLSAVQKAKAEAQKASLHAQQEQQQAQLALRNAQREVQRYQQRLLTAQAAVDQAQENYRLRTDYFAEGLEQATDLLAAEAKLAQKRLEQLNTLYEYRVALAQLELSAR